MTRKAIILTAREFEDLEVIYPKFRLEEEDWIVEVATPDASRVVGVHGYAIEPNLAFSEIDPDEYDLLLLPGGPKTGGAGIVRTQEDALEVTRRFFDEGKPVGAICHGPYTLVSAGVLTGRRLTSVPTDAVPDEIRDAGGKWVEAEMVRDGNLVTSRRPPDLPAFMAGILGLVREPRNPADADAREGSLTHRAPIHARSRKVQSVSR